MAAKKRTGARARKPAVRRAPASPKGKALHAKLQRLYKQKVELDLQIFEIQTKLTTNRDPGYCPAPKSQKSRRR